MAINFYNFNLKSFNMLSKLSTFVAVANAASWDYASNGADWTSVAAACGENNQSPINLISPDAEEFTYKIYKSTDDMIQKSYSNQFGMTNTNNKHTTQLDLDVSSTAGSNGFKS